MNITYKTNRFLFFTLLFSALAVAQEEEPMISFEPHVIFDEAMGASSVVAADIDGDDVIDVVSGSLDDDTLRWHKNDGNGSFTNHVIAEGHNPTSIAVADIDNDNDLDVLMASLDAVRWYKNNGLDETKGTIVFTEHIIHTNVNRSNAVATADIDGDGDQDVFSASHFDKSLHWHENTGIDAESDGGIGFSTRVIDSDLRGGQSLTTADIDGDEDLDIVATSSSSLTIFWYENTEDMDGNRAFMRGIIFKVPNVVSSIATADLDGDNDIDVLSTLAAVNIFWYENHRDVDGKIAFLDHAINGDVFGAKSVVTADIDGDDDLDILSSATGDNLIRWHKNNGEEVFTHHNIFKISGDDKNLGGVIAITIADIDGNNDIDVLSASSNDNTIRWYESNVAALNVAKVLPQTTILYPNPTSSDVNLSYATATHTNYSLYDMSGKRLATYEQSGTTHQIDVSNYEKSTYILKATSGLQVNYYRIVRK